MPTVDPVHYGGEPGATVDMDAALGLVAAALEGCRPCQRDGMYEVTRARDHIPATHLVATAYRLVSSVLAPIVGPMTDDHLASKYAKPTQAVFRALRDQGPEAAAAVMAGFDRAGRREAVDDALDLIAGVPDALALLESFGTPEGPGTDRIKVVTVDVPATPGDDLPPTPDDLLVMTYGPFSALVADIPSTATAITSAGAIDVNQQVLADAGFADASNDRTPPRLPAGWAVRLRGNSLVGIEAPGGRTWWEADAAGAAVVLPDQWVDAATAGVVLLVGDIGFAMTDDLGAALEASISRGRTRVGLAAVSLA